MTRRLYLIIAMCMVVSSCRFGDMVLQGYVEAEPIWLNAPVAGQVHSVTVEPGEAITMGSLVYSLQDPLMHDELQARQAEVARAQAILLDSEQGQRQSVMQALAAQVEQVQATYDLAILQYNRAQSLHQKSAITEVDYDKAAQEKNRQKAALAEAKAHYAEGEQGARPEIIVANKEALRISQSHLLQIQNQLAQMQVTAPANGFILDTYYTVGEWVNPMQPVVSMVDPSQYVIQFYIPIDLLPEAQLGKHLSFSTQGSNATYTATLSYISPEAAYTPPMVYADNNTSKFVYLAKAQLDLETSHHFRLGQPVSITWK